MTDNRRRLLTASCLAIVTNAVAGAVCTDIMGDFERAFQLTKAQVGAAVCWGALGGCIVQFLGGALLDTIGIGTMLWLACLSHTLGLTMVIGAQGFWSLTAGWFILSIAGNIVEASVNPLVATMYPDRKIHILNVLHAWWPGGLIIGGLMAYGFSKLLTAMGASASVVQMSWQIKMAFAYVPLALYALLIFRQEFPKTARAQAGVSDKDMYREALRPLFLLLVFCMFLTASAELAPNRWVGVFIQDIVGIRGILFLVYTSGLMFVLRLFAGTIATKFSPAGILIASSVVTCAGLLALSYSSSVTGIFVAATIFGIGVTYYWPTMLGVTAEWFPRGGAFLMGIMGAAAGLFISYVTIPGMGAMHDHYTLAGMPPAITAQVVVDGRVDGAKVEALPPADQKVIEDARRVAAQTTFRWVAAIPAALVLIFAALAFVAPGKNPDPPLAAQPASKDPGPSEV